MLLGLAFVGACDHQTATHSTPPSCPPCACKCACSDPGTAATPTPTPSGGTTTDPQTAEDSAALTHAITRKIAKRDGSCLADVDRLVKADPRTSQWAGMYRAQCSMLAGKCEPGKKLMVDYFAQNTEMLPEQIDRSVESMASMYCTGALDDRGELLRAMMQLQKGAYQGNIGVRACNDAFAIVVRTRDRVRPKDDEDTMVTTAKTHAHYSAASCLGRAGDCAGAFDVYRKGETKQDWARNMTDQALLEKLLRDNFQSVVPKCKGKI